MESTENLHELLFTNLIMTFHHNTMQNLGKIANPFTNKIERNLESAKMMIEMLIMLKEKQKEILMKEKKNYYRILLLNYS